MEEYIALLNRLSVTAFCPLCGDGAHTPLPEDLPETALQPILNAVCAIGAYRPSGDPASANPFSVLLRQSKMGNLPVFRRLCRLVGHFVSTHRTVLTGITFDWIVLVPTCPRRWAARGYSIPLELAYEIRDFLHIPVAENLIEISRPTRDLRMLDELERKRELEGAFRVLSPDWVAGRNLMLVDDVVTYGTTLTEIGRLLRQNDANQIVGLTLAHSEPTGISREKS